jgi:predicted nucleic acid-binding protein
MSGNKLFLDTNVILYLLNGDDTLATFLNKKELYISVITELELLGYSGISKKEEKVIREFLDECKIISINDHIKEETIRIRKQFKTKLPDSIIAASCMYMGLPFITADEEFKKISELALILYEI